MNAGNRGNRYRTPLKDVRGLGSAKTGTEHFIHQRQTATGLVVNQMVNLPRVTRRLIRAMQHRARLGRLDEAGQRRLRGLENLQQMVARQRNASGR